MGFNCTVSLKYSRDPYVDHQTCDAIGFTTYHNYTHDSDTSFFTLYPLCAKAITRYLT